MGHIIWTHACNPMVHLLTKLMDLQCLLMALQCPFKDKNSRLALTRVLQMRSVRIIKMDQMVIPIKIRITSQTLRVQAQMGLSWVLIITMVLQWDTTAHPQATDRIKAMDHHWGRDHHRGMASTDLQWELMDLASKMDNIAGDLTMDLTTDL